MSLIKVVITGPESTGKSTLAKQLAEYYRTQWVEEYAREYLNKLNRSYSEEDLLKIAKGQLQLEKTKARLSKKILICDTDLITIKIWADYKYGKTDPWILETIKKQFYDVYLLMDIDLPWAEDPQREHPDKRKYFFKKFQDELKKLQKPYHIISGNHEERFKNVVEIIDRLIT